MKERIIYIEDIPFESFTKIRVFQAANQHMRAEFIGIVSREFATDCGERGIYSKTVSVQIYDEDNKKYTWLNGIIEDFRISACGGVHTLSLAIVSHSKKSDIKRHMRTFQDATLTYEDVISILSKNSGEDGMEVLIQNAEGKKAIDDFLVQYGETDWEFLKRLASRCHSFLFPCANLERNGIYLGMHPYLVIEGIPITQLDRLEIHCQPGMHGWFRFSGYIEEGSGETLIYGMPEHTPVRILADGMPMFCGLLTSVKVSGKGNTCYVDAEGKTRSILMDQKKRSRSFQDVQMTYRELAQIILSEYPGGEIMFSLPEVPIGEIAVQYRETDWQFLKLVEVYQLSQRK